MDQLSFASLDYAAKKKRTKRDVFLAEMAGVVPWAALEAVIDPHYPRTGPQGGRRPFPLATMLRIYCLQQWYTLSDPGVQRKPSTTFNRCARSVGLSSAATPFRMRRRY
jgi:IS5 family transposase